MSLNKASIAVALAAFLAVGGIAGQALAAPHDGHDGHWRQQRSYQDCIYQALTQEKKAQYDAIMKEFADKTAPLRDKLSCARSATVPLQTRKPSARRRKNSWRSATNSPRNAARWWTGSPRKSASIYFKARGRGARLNGPADAPRQG